MTSVTASYEESTQMPPLDRVSRAVLVVDVVESVRLIEADAETWVRGWIALLETIEHKILPPIDGILVKRLGDGALIALPDGWRAARAAFDILAAVDDLNADLSPDNQTRLRLGIDLGEVVETPSDIYGNPVNRAARLIGLARPGDVVVSASVVDQLAAPLDAEIEDLGECVLRHVGGTVRAFRLTRPGSQPAIRTRSGRERLRPTLAVVPFATGQLPEAYAAMGDILAEEIIRQIAHSRDLQVISRLSTRAFRARASALSDLRSGLNADYVLSGVLRDDRDGLRLTAELAESANGEVLWCERIGLPAQPTGNTDVDAAIDQLVAATASSVLAREMERTRTTAVANLRSYSLMLGAVGLMHRLTRSDFDEARQYLIALNDRASQQAVPLAWLAHWHILRVQQGWSPDIRRDTMQARTYARQAIEADDQCSLALAAEGFVRTNLLKDLVGARESYHRALAANPNDPLASLLLGTCHAFLGEGGAAVSHCEQALRLSPLDPHRYFYLSLSATAYLADGQYDAALACAEASYRANRAHTSTLRALMVAHWKLGHRDPAKRTLAELRRLEPELTVGAWRARSPSAAYPIGRDWAETMAEIGLPE